VGKDRFRIILAMLIFGSIGLFIRNIDLSSAQIALTRGMVGSLFLMVAGLLTRKRPSWKEIRPYFAALALSGAAIGFNWILLFQAYRYTSIANATLSYYFAPVFVIFLSPFLLKEKLSAIRLACVFAAVAGMFLIIGAESGAGQNHLLGISYGLMAAVLYATAVIINKRSIRLGGMETTIIQLAMASLVLLPYVLAREKVEIFKLDARSELLLLTVGIIHTGLAYFLYFSSIKSLDGQTIAILSYIDPISAVIFAGIIFAEPMSLRQMIGAVLVLGAGFAGELFGSRTKQASRIGQDK